MIFTDESSFFSIFQGKERFWKMKNQPDIVTPTVKHPLKINIWGGFCSKGVTDLVRIEGNLDKNQFLNILDQNFMKYKNKTFKKKRNKGVLQMDNDPKHKSKLVQSYLKRK